MSAQVFKILKGVVRGSDGKIYRDEVPRDVLGKTEQKQQKFIREHVASGQLEAKKKPKAPAQAPAQAPAKAPDHSMKKGGKK